VRPLAVLWRSNRGAQRQHVRSRNAFPTSPNCGDEGTRTLNPRRAKAVLYQLSYVPGPRPQASGGDLEVGRGGLAPKVGLCLRRALTLDKDKRNQTDEQQHDHLLHDGSPPCQDGDSPVGLAGLEPATSSLSGMRSNRLSYRPPHDAARLPHCLHRAQLACAGAEIRCQSGSDRVTSIPPTKSATTL
jgi:hypothetical protein